MDLDHVAGELYALPPEEFTAARKARVAEARRAGDRELAAAIGGLRRPTASAALVNLLTRQQPELIDDLLDLADELRAAQSARAGEDLRRLSTRRNQVVSTLVEHGKRLAAGHQHPATAQVETELTATLQAALADPEAAQWLRSGRLTTAVQYSGFGMTLNDGGERPGAPPPPRQRSRPPPEARPSAPATPPAADDAPERQLTAAKEALAAAQNRLAGLVQDAAHAQVRLTEAQARRQAAIERIDDLERQLAGARDGAREAAREVRPRERERDKADRAVEAARRRVEQSERPTERLRPR